VTVGEPSPAGPVGDVYPGNVEEDRIPEDPAAGGGGQDPGEAGDEETGPPIPPLADALLGPLLDSAGEALRHLSPADLAPAARRLRSFDRRGLATPAARHQIRRLLEEDEELLEAAAAVLLARPEASRLATAWEEAVAAGGGGPLALVDDAAREGRLALLASVLTAALPPGFEFGLGLVVATAAIGERESAAAQTTRAATAAQGTAEEARRRAEAARATAAAEVARLDGALRDERQARRQLEQSAADAAGSDARRVDLEAALTEARQLLVATEQRATAAERRAAEADKRIAAAVHRAASSAGRPSTGDLDGRALDGRALDQLARAAEDLALALRRLASGPPPRSAPAPGSRAGPEVFETQPRPPPPRRPAAPPPPPGTGVGKPAPAPERSRPATRRAPVQVPPGMLHDDPAAVAAMVRTRGLAVIVDGYNVSMLAWPEANAADQRDRLCDALVEFQLRTRCEVTVVFDGADVPGVRPLRRRGLRVVFSAAGQEADEVVVGEVMFRPAEVPVIVVSSDREVRVASEAEGATVLPADTFLQLMRR
jgi:predicted RNA-binding protein with PIN domain